MPKPSDIGEKRLREIAAKIVAEVNTMSYGATSEVLAVLRGELKGLLDMLYARTCRPAKCQHQHCIEIIKELEGWGRYE